MGLTKSSVGTSAAKGEIVIERKSPSDRVIAIAGNPNVGKSTLFNSLTGMHQHTGNWPGKTVTNAVGNFTTDKFSYTLVDIPGTYSLLPHSAEEEVARNFVCFGEPDAVVVVCDATCLERNLNLVLQTCEIAQKVLVCINLADEAKKKKIYIDEKKLSELLGVPVIKTVARNKKSLSALTCALDMLCEKPPLQSKIQPVYPEKTEVALCELCPVLESKTDGRINSRWLALRLLEGDCTIGEELNKFLGKNILDDAEVQNALSDARNTISEKELLTSLSERELFKESFKDSIVSTIVTLSEKICESVVSYGKKSYDAFDRRTDKILTGRLAGFPVMLLMLCFIFWLTIEGANYPSSLLSQFFLFIQNKLTALFTLLGAPEWLHGVVVLGGYRVLAWVVAVMLPPMAIFFPLFTLLEDSGYLPRVAYNLDKPFKKCNACGKQALTMCMGFGCNAAGIVGCRIIDSKRERLLAILTNNFVPCNGRFPALIAIISMFFVLGDGIFQSFGSALILTLIILAGILSTFATTYILSKTILQGEPSSFTLELPPYRRPQIGAVIVRSIFDRTLFVLGRACAVALPAGVFLWLIANISVGGASLLAHTASFLDPLARLMGLDGVILVAFILGFPANEIVIPIIIMAYLGTGSILELDSLYAMRELFVSNGWSVTTAICFMLFSLLHWPCSTSLITVKKETGSIKYTLLAAIIPTVCGIAVCMATNLVLSFVI